MSTIFLIRKITNIHHELNIKSSAVLFVAFLAVKLFYSITTSIVATWIDPSLTAHSVGDENLLAVFLLSIVFAPIMETFIFQFFIIELLLSFNVRAISALFISAAAFAAIHYYNVVYIAAMFLAGLMYAYYYYLLRSRDKLAAVLWVTLLHATWNFIAFLNNDVLKWF